VLAACVFLLQS